MELIRGTVPVVSFRLPTSDSSITTVTWARGTEGGTLAPSAPEDGIVTVTLPYQQYDGLVVITWSLVVPGSGSFEEKTYHEVITPVVDYPTLEALLAGEDCDVDAQTLERSVRHVIQAHTGQEFGKRSETVTVRTDGQSKVPLPSKLLSYTQVNGNNVENGLFEISSDGWYLNAMSKWDVPPIRADYFGINEATVYTSGVPITAPPFWRTGAIISITGEWGWHAVPQAVREAGLLLANDYAGDSIYRDRYLTSMTAADWRIQFHDGAFAQTGNVRADQLLANYTLSRGWVV
jgi:hypothetical protein